MTSDEPISLLRLAICCSPLFRLRSSVINASAPRPITRPLSDCRTARLSSEHLLEQLRDELIGRTYQPLPARRQEIPKDGGKVRVLSIPAIRDRVVQGALKLILEPVFEADFQPGSFG